MKMIFLIQVRWMNTTKIVKYFSILYLHMLELFFVSHLALSKQRVTLNVLASAAIALKSGVPH